MPKLADIKNKIVIAYEQWGNVYNSETNETDFVLMADAVTLTKGQSKDIGKVGTLYKYIFTIDNADDVPMTNIMFEDPLSHLLKYQAGTYKVNGVLEADPDFERWITLPDVPANSTTVVEFFVKVVKTPDQLSEEDNN